MTIDIQPIDPVNRSFFAGVVSGLDLSRPLSPQDVAAVHAGMDQFGVLVFHDQKIDDDQQLVFSRSLGPLEQATGDNTEFADMRAAYDALDEVTKREVHDLICLHSQIFSRGILGFTDFTDAEREKWAPVRQRLVRRHPRTGRLSLYLSSHAGGIEGWPMPEARDFLRDLNEHATQRKLVYAHVWQPADLVMWDNRVTMHRARRYDHVEVRDMRRTTLTNEVSSLEQAPEEMSSRA